MNEDDKSPSEQRKTDPTNLNL